MLQIFDVSTGILQLQVRHNIHHYDNNYIVQLPDGQGNWSTDGCTTVYDRDDTDNVTCLCNHLTNFACLVVR